MGLTFIDFFAGIGGFRLGMEMAGHECVGHCEIDKFADKSYRAMHDVKEWEWYANDIRNVEPGDLPEADCWCGGFPCQAFSIAGKRRGFEDMRGTLIFEIFRLASERRPKILFLENVAGLLNHDGGRTFATILCGLWELGYNVQWQVLNSKDFGVPQNRERVFIIGHLGERSGREVFPIYGTNGEDIKQLIGGSQGYRVYDPDGSSVTLASQAGGMGAKTGLYMVEDTSKSGINVVGYTRESVIKDRTRILGTDGNCQALRATDYKDPAKIAVPVLTPDQAEKRQNGRRFKEDGDPMFTLTAQDKHGIMVVGKVNSSQDGVVVDPQGISKAHTSGHNNSPKIMSGCRIRRLTPKECFRLQGFPDTYFERAAAVNSDTQLYKQAGNSVTVNVIYEIAKRL